MPCIKPYMSVTMEGNRNENLFRATNHVYFRNKRVTPEKLHEISHELNQYLHDPLSNYERKQVTEHILKHSYYSSCKRFKTYCKRCPYGTMKLPYNQVANHWKYMDRNNYLKSFYGFRNALKKGDKVHPWDIVDTTGLTYTQKREVWRLRRSKGWNIKIDELLRNQGILIDDEALTDFLNYSKN